MRVLLRDLAPGQQYAIQFRSNDGAGNTSDWSQVQRFTTTNDTMPPGPILNLTWYNSGASFIAQWDPVVVNQDGTPMKDLRDYHVRVSNGQTYIDFYMTGNYFEFTNAQNLAAFTSLQTTLTVTVTARDLTYNEGAGATLTVSPSSPPTPSTPTVGNYLGLLLVSWDTLTSARGPMPTNFTYCEIHASATSGFTPDATTLVGRVYNSGANSQSVVSGLNIGTLYYVRLIAVNQLNKKSGPSTQASGTPKSISGVDIQNGQIAAEQINWTSTNIPGGNAYYQTSQPTQPIGAHFNVGDVWYDTDDGYTAYSWNGTLWALNTNIGFIPGGKIVAGTITADKVGANQIITASANIANGVIDTAHISTLDAGVIQTGLLQSSLQSTYGGVSQPAWSFDLAGNAVLNTVQVYGQLTLGASTNPQTQNQAALVRSYNYVSGTSGWAIKGDGTVEFSAGTFRGQLITGNSGSRRTEILNTGVSAVNFYSSTGLQSHVQSQTITDPANGGVYEVVQIAAPLAGYPGNLYWNAWSASNHTDTGLGNLNGRGDNVQITYSNKGGFMVFKTPDGNQASTLGVFQLAGDGTVNFWPYKDFNVNFQSGNNFNINSAGTGNLAFSGNLNITTTGGGLQWSMGSGRGNINFWNVATSAQSAVIQMFNGNGLGGGLRFYDDGTTQRIETIWWNQSSYLDHYAAAFITASDARLKTAVADADTTSMLDKVMNMKVRQYNMLKHNDASGKMEPSARTEFGFIAQEVPVEILGGGALTTDPNSNNGIDLYKLTTQLYGAFQEAIKELRGEIAALKKGNK